MNNQQKLLTCLLAGAATGAAIAWFLQTEKGQELADSLKSSFKDFAEDAKDKITSKWHDFDKGIDGLLKKGKDFVEDIENKTEDAIS
jgi:gas vesicle protein